jgi:hypothetical protein
LELGGLSVAERMGLTSNLLQHKYLYYYIFITDLPDAAPRDRLLTSPHVA